MQPLAAACTDKGRRAYRCWRCAATCPGCRCKIAHRLGRLSEGDGSMPQRLAQAVEAGLADTAAQVVVGQQRVHDVEMLHWEGLAAALP